MKCIVSEDVVLSRPLEGSLSAHIVGFAKWARDEGYALYSRQRQVLLAACFLTVPRAFQRLSGARGDCVAGPT